MSISPTKNTLFKQVFLDIQVTVIIEINGYALKSQFEMPDAEDWEGVWSDLLAICIYRKVINNQTNLSRNLKKKKVWWCSNYRLRL